MLHGSFVWAICVGSILFCVGTGLRPVQAGEAPLHTFKHCEWNSDGAKHCECHPERARVERSEMSASRRTLCFDSAPEEVRIRARLQACRNEALKRSGFSRWKT